MSATPRVLIVDDQPAVVQALRVLLDLHDIPNVTAESPREAVRRAAAEPLAAVIQDMNFSRSETSGAEGIDLFHTLRQADPDLPILLITAWASLETAVELVRDGAVDYIQKPWDDERLIEQLERLLAERRRALEKARGLDEAETSRRELESRHDLCGLVWASAAMGRLLGLAVSVADSDAPVLVSGPSGSGKERIAEIIQANSRRRRGPFVRVNLGAIPEELIESELFGAEPGAYTGAQRRRIGHFETADGGTLFLDEIDALSLAGQVKLLRVLQRGEFQRLGSSQTRTVDVRIVSATNADLERALADGRFREDLFFRLNVVELEVPPLARRPDDLMPLVRHFLERYGDRGHELAPEAEAALMRHDWPGNVRELENRVRRATLLAGERPISAADLGLGTGGAGHGPSAAAGAAGRRDLSAADELERRQVLDALERAEGVVAHAADRLGISRQALYRKMDRLGVEVERRPRG